MSGALSLHIFFRKSVTPDGGIDITAFSLVVKNSGFSRDFIGLVQTFYPRSFA
ncbi:hypothetical protein C943_03541 [Mariniradius saccharolyticus AK6]|uniref:Uncharacterized protein n=1 Tax=Mariniradius saccharolyticus AK6 TaxID=1239962 RepID=M7Y0S3_9BACT|nr:hypothetical protein C943_03541 [Mariniradius saccharolyticus AK6]